MIRAQRIRKIRQFLPVIDARIPRDIKRHNPILVSVAVRYHQVDDGGLVDGRGHGDEVVAWF